MRLLPSTDIFRYAVIGFAGYAAFGTATQDDILLNFTPKAGFNTKGMEVLFLSGKLAMVFCLVLSFPLVNFPCRICLHTLLRGSLGPRLPLALRRAPPAFWFYAETLVIAGGTYAVSYFVPKMISVFGLTGAVTGSLLVYIMPCAFYLRALRIQARRREGEKRAQAAAADALARYRAAADARRGDRGALDDTDGDTDGDREVDASAGGSAAVAVDVDVDVDKKSPAKGGDAAAGAAIATQGAGADLIAEDRSGVGNSDEVGALTLEGTLALAAAAAVAATRPTGDGPELLPRLPWRVAWAPWAVLVFGTCVGLACMAAIIVQMAKHGLALPS